MNDTVGSSATGEVYRPRLSLVPPEKQEWNEGVKATSTGGGSGGGNGMNLEPRIAKLESDVGHINRDISTIKEDVKDIRNWGVGFFITGCALVLIASMYVVDKQWEIQGTQASNSAEIRTVSAVITSISSDVSKILERTDNDKP